MSLPNFIELKNAKVESANYFVDANVWIYSLQNFDDLAHWQNAYYQFFYDIFESTLDPKPRILLPPLLISEITNTYLRNFAVTEYKLENAIPSTDPFDFKKNYRNTQHYKDSYEKIMDDIQSFHSSIKFLDDKDIAHNSSVLFNKSINPFDYNDYLYYSMCKELNQKEKVIILTNDGDFQVTDLPIITANKTLLNLS